MESLGGGSGTEVEMEWLMWRKGEEDIEVVGVLEERLRIGEEETGGSGVKFMFDKS